ncbi:hypothetical protein KC318_g1836 [Hortaea werneckii]|nr:hypothetical protein KC334_g1701 [Hortaea werneckii]KAI7021654.1 hypothetical protein KC355_g2291 [Hortaea werneckii]KAI7674066.1 hypothetical protein KC318_g1836 [Hortaea werneckii]
MPHPKIPARITQTFTDPNSNFTFNKGTDVLLLGWDAQNATKITKGRVQRPSESESGARWVPESAIYLIPSQEGDDTWPFVVINSWKPGPSDSCKAIRRGERGRLVKWSQTGRRARVEFPDRNPSKEPVECWIETSHIQIGYKRYGEITTRNKNLLSEIDVKVEVPADRTKPEKCLLAIMAAFAQNKKKIPLLMDRIWPLIQGARERELATRSIMSGIEKAGLLHIFTHDGSSIEDIAKSGRSADTDTRAGAGIYARIYARAKAQDTSTAYTGSTINFGKRAGSHAQNLKSPKYRGTPHGRAFNGCKKRWVVVLSELDPNERSLILLAEQLLMIMLGTYDERVLSKLRSEQSSEGAQRISADSVFRDIADLQEPELDNTVIKDAEIDLVEQDGEEEISEKGGRGARWRAMKDAAAQIMLAGGKAMAQVGWTPFLDRNFALNEHGRYTGLNIQSPLATTYGCVVWTRLNVPGGMEVYYRPSLQCRVKPTTKFLGKIGGKPPASVEFSCSSDIGPPDNTKVTFVCEITKDGSPHPYEWARLPTVCRYDDAKRARSLGVRIEWTENQQVHTMTLGHVRILDVTFDHLRQETFLEETSKAIEKIASGNPKSNDILVAELKSLGLQNVDSEKKVPREDKGHKGPKVEQCDRCRLEKVRKNDDYTTSSARCVIPDGEHRCVTCMEYGVPCTFTPLSELQGPEGTKLRQALWFRKPRTDAIILLDDPQYHYGLVDEAPSDNRPSSSPWAHLSPASGSAGPSSISGIGHSGPSGRGMGTPQTPPDPISMPTRSKTAFVSPPLATPSLSDRRATSGNSNPGTGDGGQVIASGRPRAASAQTPTGAFRHPSMDKFFARPTPTAPQTPTAGPSNLPGSPLARLGSSGSGNGGTGDGGRFIAPGHSRHLSAQTMSHHIWEGTPVRPRPAAGAADSPSTAVMKRAIANVGSGDSSPGDSRWFTPPSHMRHSSAQIPSVSHSAGPAPPGPVPSGHSSRPGASGSGSRASATFGQAQSVPGPGRLPPPAMPFNAQHVTTLLQYGRIEDLESAMRIIAPQAQRDNNLSNGPGARVGRLVKELRSAAKHLCNNAPVNSDIVDRASQVLRDVRPLFHNLSAPFAPSRFVDRHGQQIRDRIPTAAEARICINRYAVHGISGTQLLGYIEDLCAVEEVDPSEHQIAIREALAHQRRPFKQLSPIEHAALPSNDEYRGDMLPAIPGTTEYLVDPNGSRLSSREAIERYGKSYTAAFDRAQVGGVSTAQARARIETQFERLRNLYHFTGSRHLLVVAEYYNEVVVSWNQPSLWDKYHDDSPATNFS